MPTLTATLVGYYHTCPRKLWLHAHGIRMEHTSDIVYEGKLIEETSYTDRAAKNTQLELSIPLPGDEAQEEWMGAAKIDFYDPQTRTVYETKKSDRAEEAHIAQVKFYLYVLLKSGIEDARGIIEYPKQRDRTQVSLTPEDLVEVEKWIAEIRGILEKQQCPPVIRKPVCKQCSYYDYCYSDEDAM